MSKWDGLVSPRRAADIIGVHYMTVIDWCRKAENGEETRLARVERDPANGHYKVSIRGVKEHVNARKK